MTQLQRAAEALQNNNYTFVCINGNTVYTSTAKGIAPIMEQLEEPSPLCCSSIADKVIGKAAALLLIKGHIKELYAEILSEYAHSVLEASNIKHTWGRLVPYIINRTGDGMCPMEQCVLEINDPEEAYKSLVKKLAQLRAAQ